ncbi:MAG: hypothetical protein CBD58_04940 [bacterium TMED198]|nr:MAG: hypothetical protein CBD58_04940 [bacterium TMED198]
MFLKRQMPLLIVIGVGFLTLLGHFINNQSIQNYVDNDGMQWFDIIASFAAILGALNLIKVQAVRVVRKQNNWQYSTIAILGFALSIIAGFFYIGVDDVAWGAHVQTEGTLFKWIFFNLFTPLSATMFALLAFFVASASYRAFRIRNFEATLLLISGIVLMIGRVPIGSEIPWWFASIIYVLGIVAFLASFLKSKINILFSVVFGIASILIIGYLLGWSNETPALLSFPVVASWIFDVPTAAGSRAIMIGVGLGIAATSFRIIIGLERSFLGD